MDLHTVVFDSHINLQSKPLSPGAAPQNTPILYCWFSPKTWGEKFNLQTKFFTSTIQLCLIQFSSLNVWAWLYLTGRESVKYHRSIVDSHRLDAPGNTEPNQDIKDITANCVGDSHISQACGCTHTHTHTLETCKEELKFQKLLNRAWMHTTVLPCRATIRLAIQSGTLVPAARKVMPIMTSGIPSV